MLSRLSKDRKLCRKYEISTLTLSLSLKAICKIYFINPKDTNLQSVTIKLLAIWTDKALTTECTDNNPEDKIEFISPIPYLFVNSSTLLGSKVNEERSPYANFFICFCPVWQPYLTKFMIFLQLRTLHILEGNFFMYYFSIRSPF